MKIDVNLATVREKLLSLVGWHAAGFVVLLGLTITLGVRLGLDWVATHGSSTEALSSKQVELKAIDLQTTPLRGLDKRVDEAHKRLAGFYAKRVPPNYSAISMRIGDLGVKSGVRLGRVQYTQGKPGSVLTEIAMDASISGDYPSIMRFINGLERDEEFFLIKGMNFTGQQAGQVNLRIQISTWLRPADAIASGLPETPEPGSPEAVAAAKAAAGEDR